MQPNIIKSAMSNGLIMGVLFSLNFFLSIPKITILGLVTYLVMALIVVLMYRMSVRFRDTECGGYISYGKAFTYIIYTFFFAALISSIVKYTYFRIYPTYLENLLQDTLKAVETMKIIEINDEFYDQMTQMMKPANLALQYIWVNMFVGVIVGLVMAAFVKKEKSIFEE